MLLLLLVPAAAPAAAPTAAPACVPRNSFTSLSLDEATLVRSNLGGLGGRCVDRTFCAVNKRSPEFIANGGCPTNHIFHVRWNETCEEPQTAATPRNLYLRGIGSEEGMRIRIGMRMGKRIGI